MRDWNHNGKIDAGDRAHQYHYINQLYGFDKENNKPQNTNSSGSGNGIIIFLIILTILCPPIGLLAIYILLIFSCL